MELSRRNFIGKTTMATACAASYGFTLAACRGATRADLGPAGLRYEPVPTLPDDLSEVLYYASLSPSGHNAQPWYVRVVDEKTWIIGSDPQRRLPAVDPNNRETLLSIGAFAENLSIAAGAKGYEAEMEVVADGASNEDIIRVSLNKATPSGYPLNRIVSRRKVKDGHRPTELKSDDVKFLSEPFEDRLFYFPCGSEHSDCIAEGAIEAFRAQAYRNDAQAELSEWIRFSNKDARKYRDGLTPESMEIGGIAGWYVRNFMDKSNVMTESFREQGIKGAVEAANQGAGWFVITGEGEGVADLIDTGRRFERMFLLARERMIAIAPMMQMLEENRWQGELASQHEPEMIPQLIIRVGYLDTYPDPVTLRRPVSWFLRT